MNRKSVPATLTLVALSVVLLSASFTTARQQEKKAAARAGILLLAHGGNQKWNDEVKKIAAQSDPVFSTEVAFGMASKRNIQSAIDRLAARGVSEIVAVPLFVSPYSSVITSTEYLLGLRAVAPRELAIYARMDHSHGSHSGSHSDSRSGDASFDPTTPVKSPVPVRMTPPMGRHPVISDILLARARSISRDPEREVVILVAHGPVSDEEDAKWLDDMGALVERMRGKQNFKRIEYMTVRDDAPEPVRAKATAELRSRVERAQGEGHSVLIVPLLVSYGGIEEGIRKRLDGLSYVMSPQALLPDERIVGWVIDSARSATRN